LEGARAATSLSIGRFGVLDEIGQQRFGQLGRVVLGGGFEGVEQRRDRRGTSWLLQCRDRGWLASPRDTGEPLDRCCGHTLGRRGTQVERADRFEAIEVPEEFGRCPPGWYRAQRVERGERGGVVIVEQPRDPGTLHVAETTDQVAPEPSARPVPDAADHALQDCDARQEHLVGDQPGGRAFDQRPGVVVPAPAKRVEPTRQAEARAGIVAKVGEAEPVSDQREVADAAPALEIAVEGDPCRQAELIAHCRQNGFGNDIANAGKGPKEAGAGEHRRKAEPVMRAAQIGEDLLVGPIQMKVSRQLIGRRLAIEAREALALRIGEMAGRHGVRTFQRLRGPDRPRKSGGLPLAKYLCDNIQFCNMICEHSGAAA